MGIRVETVIKVGIRQSQSAISLWPSWKLHAVCLWSSYVCKTQLVAITTCNRSPTAKTFNANHRIFLVTRRLLSCFYSSLTLGIIWHSCQIVTRPQQRPEAKVLISDHQSDQLKSSTALSYFTACARFLNAAEFLTADFKFALNIFLYLLQAT